MTKRSRGGGGAGGGGAIAAPSPDLKPQIHDHSLFFDHLIELIPARFYLPAPDADDRTPYPFLPKSEKAAARQESRENVKKSRRGRLDPSSPATTLDLLHQTIQNQSQSAANLTSDDDAENPRPPPRDDRPERAITYEELRERLHRRIEESRSNRNTRPTAGFALEDRRKKKKEKEAIIKNNRKSKKEGGTAAAAGKRKASEPAVKDKKDSKKARPAEDVKDIAFGQVRIGGEEKKKKKKQLSKEQALEKAKRLEEAKKDPEKGEKLAEKHSWKAAADRAAGLKVHDDPKLIMKGIKKEKKMRQKHAEQWKERVKGTDKMKMEKQKVRTDNIKKRAQEKKQRRIEKREKKLLRPGFERPQEKVVLQPGFEGPKDKKKLMRIEKTEKKLLRPGFEGRKEGYVNE